MGVKAVMVARAATVVVGMVVAAAMVAEGGSAVVGEVSAVEGVVEGVALAGVGVGLEEGAVADNHLLLSITSYNCFAFRQSRTLLY